MTRLILSLVGGLTLGATLGLIGIGLVLAFRATKVFNFAHGELMLLPAFIVGYQEANHSSFWPTLVLALVAPMLATVAFYWLVLRRTAGLSLFMGIIATLGLASILDGLMAIFFPAGQYVVTLPRVPTGHVTIAGVGVGEATLIFSGLMLLIAIVVIAVMRFTHLGLRIRAAGLDPILASQCGLKVQRLHAGSWAIAALLAAIAGISFGTVATATTAMVELGLAALPAILLGGLDSIEGAVIGGFGVGMMQSFTQTYFGGEYVNAVTYGVLLVVMLIYPEGIFGSTETVRAA